MPQPGTAEQPLRVAIVGSGPAGFFVAQRLLNQKDVVVEVDMYDRLPTPFGLVRFGVAPDHQEIKAVIRTFEKTAANPRFRFFGNVDVSAHVTLDDLRTCYHQICFTTGAQTDRRMNIPGEDLLGSHAATEFVAWYNGHPEYCDRTFDLSAERVAVIGVGNVAVDVARVLARSEEELAGTDIADHALEALRESRVKEVVMLGRRGPAQAAFTNAEVRELGELAGADIEVRPEEVELDPLSRAAVEKEDDRTLHKKLEILDGFARQTPAGKPRRLAIRFLVSPVELVGDASGRVKALKIARNQLVLGNDGDLRAKSTDHIEEMPVGLVFRSVGYHGIPIPGLPFDQKGGVVPNSHGRVIDSGSGQPMRGLYVSGWIKRGPTGVIGTNKPDGFETADAMLQDRASGALLAPATPSADAALNMVVAKQPRVVSYADWRKLDEIEVKQGRPAGRPRVKLTNVEEMLRALGR